MKLRHPICGGSGNDGQTGGDGHPGAGSRPQRHVQGFARRSVDFQPPAAAKRSRNFNRIIVNVGHFDVWDYGSNFCDIEVLFSNANEPANNSAGGSTGFYAVYRGQFSPDKVLGTQTASGPISAINSKLVATPRGKYPIRAGQETVGRRPRLSCDGAGGLSDHRRPFFPEWNNNGFSNCPYSRFVHGRPGHSFSSISTRSCTTSRISLTCV
jgi:hypothetical protein